MDSITRTAQSALVNYYNALRRMGSTHRQDKYRLLVLWMFHELKNNSDFLYRFNRETKEFEIDRELESWLESRYRCSLQCLVSASCFIKLLPDDNCTPVLEILWGGPEEEETYRLLVTNGTYAMNPNVNPKDYDDVNEMLEALMMTNGSYVIAKNDSDEHWMTVNDNNKTQL